MALPFALLFRISYTFLASLLEKLLFYALGSFRVEAVLANVLLVSKSEEKVRYVLKVLQRVRK